MTLGYVLIGAIAGLLGLATTLMMGKSFLSALLAYVVVGSATLLLLPTLMYARHRLSRAIDDDGIVDNTDAADEGADDAKGYMNDALGSASGSMTILAVDDDPFIRELLPKIAAKAGFPHVTAVDSAEAALRELMRSPTRFGCILLDINMPGTDGIELCAGVRRIPAYQQTPIIMLTAMADAEHLDRAFKAGATDYTTKPFDVIEFAERLKAAATSHTTEQNAIASKASHPAERVSLPDTSAEIATGLFDPRKFENVTSFIELTALSNYLERLSGRKLVRSTVMVVQIVDAEALRAGLSERSFQLLLEEIAGTVDDMFARDGYVGAYAGRGQFVLLCDWDAVAQQSKREADLQYHADRKNVGRSLGLLEPVQLVLGTPVRPRSMRKNRARNAIGTAMDLAEVRAAGAAVAGSPYPTKLA